MVEVYFEKVGKYFGTVRAVEDFTLKVRDKEFMVLLGPSGCGKTTTLRLTAGLERPTKGHVYFGDRIMDDVHPRFRNVSMVFQSYALFPHMSVFDNVAFPLKAAKWPKEKIRARTEEVAKMLRIGDLLDRRPYEISGGQQQRVALGRAMVRKPDVLLLDEPLANLDAKLRAIMRGELKRLQREFECTTIQVTHDQVEAMSMADRITLMNEGRIQQVGAPVELYDSPKSEFVAGFIGTPSINLIDCSFREEKSLLDFGPFTIKIPKDMGDLLKGHTEVIFGIRPRHVGVSDSGSPGAIESEVYVVEPLGEETIITLEIEGVRIMVAVTQPTFKAEMGEKLWVSFNLDRAHVFDRKSEKALI